MAPARKHTELPILFWTKVDMEHEYQCWTWLGGVTQEGQAVMSVWFEDEGRWIKKSASHVAIFLRYGYWVAKGIQIKRTCKNALCVNTAHFKLE